MCVSSWRGVWAGAIIALAVSGARAEPLGPAWLASAEAARQQSLTTGKPILIYFYGERCPACKVMQRDVLSRADVLETLRTQYVLMQANADQVPALAKQYGVVALPTTVAITADGQTLDKIQGRLDAANYVARLNQTAAAARRAPAAAASQIAAAPPSSPAGLPRMGDYTPPMPGGYLPAPGAAPTANVPPPPAAPAASYAPAAAAMTMPPTGANGYHPATPAVPPAATQPQIYAASQTGQAFPQPTQQSPVAAIATAADGAPPVPTATAPAMGDRGYYPAQNTAMPAGVAPQPAAPVVPHSATPGIGGAAASYAPPVPGPQQAAPPATPEAGTAAGHPAAAINPPLALDGFCPVDLCERQRWTPGDPRYGLVHRGRTYLFAGAEQRDRFNADPDRYAPILSGTDIVLAIEQGRQLEGQRRHGVFYNGRVYLFSSEESLQRFAQRPDFYADQALQAMRAGAVPVYYR